MEKLLTKDGLAEFIGMSISTINRHLEAGILPCHKFGTHYRFTSSDVTAYLENLAVPATAMPSNRQKLAIAKAIGHEKKAEKESDS